MALAGGGQVTPGNVQPNERAYGQCCEENRLFQNFTFSTASIRIRQSVFIQAKLSHLVPQGLAADPQNCRGGGYPPIVFCQDATDVIMLTLPDEIGKAFLVWSDTLANMLFQASPNKCSGINITDL